MMAAYPKLVSSRRVDLPVVEASGIAVRRARSAEVVLVIGDRAETVGVCRVGAAGELTDWDTIDLSTIPGWPTSDGDSQLEAIAVDGGTLVAVMREDPPVVLIADTETRAVVTTIELTAPAGSPLHGAWDDPSSRGEGMVLLRHGRLLVAKEKRPRALVEFAPVGSAAMGLCADDFLAADEPWAAPNGATEFVAVAMWKLAGTAKKALGDISSIGVGRTGELWLLSDKSTRVARVSLAEPLLPEGGEITEFASVWDLPDEAEKPEGIAVLDDGRVIVAMDTRSTVGNGLVVVPPGR
jgi:uncharacterized protein YjiK